MVHTVLKHILFMWQSNQWLREIPKSLNDKLYINTLSLMRFGLNFQIGEDVVCCRCSLEVYRKRQEFNVELAKMRTTLDNLKKEQRQEVDTCICEKKV